LMNQIPALYALAPAMVLLIAFLMISTIPYPAFKKSSLLRPRSVWLPPILVFAAAVILIYPQNAIFLIFFAYVLLGPVGWLLRLARRIFWRPSTEPDRL